MFKKHTVHYTVEVKIDDGSYLFVCSFATFDEARERTLILRDQTGNECRILKIEKDIEEVS
jgi:hypothetical protein